MFAKLKKKLAEEAATAPRSGRIPRSMSKESITSVGADSGDDFTSDGSSSRDDVSSQIQRRNDQIRKLEAKLSDYAEQLRLMQKTKEKLEIALEKYQDSSMRKLQDQNEAFQTNRAKMAEGMALALEKKDQEWIEKLATLEQEKLSLAARLDEMTEQSLSLFQKRDDLDELEGFQQQELAKVKHMLLRREEQLSQREKELKLRGEELNTPDPDSETKERLQESRQEKSTDKTISETPMPATAPTPASGLPQTSGLPPITSNTTVTNSSDLTDTREINFEYLKHVVLKFMSSREAEAFQLIRAISVLLHFTKEEEDMLKQTLEYKMSWFGSKPTPKGIIRPSISGTSSWS
uniref:Golgin subfamily A member 1 n=1 Tax=Sinocyclocheilus anshuiensis TaxID=1608454 RepID=A0A671LNM8_9TELE